MVHRSFKQSGPVEVMPPLNHGVSLYMSIPCSFTVLKVTERRDPAEFRDEVSKRMGQLLLKGYTMLDAYCSSCQVRKCRYLSGYPIDIGNSHGAQSQRTHVYRL